MCNRPYRMKSEYLAFLYAFLCDEVEVAPVYPCLATRDDNRFVAVWEFGLLNPFVALVADYDIIITDIITCERVVLFPVCAIITKDSGTRLPCNYIIDLHDTHDFPPILFNVQEISENPLLTPPHLSSALDSSSLLSASVLGLLDLPVTLRLRRHTAGPPII